MNAPGNGSSVPSSSATPAFGPFAERPRARLLIVEDHTHTGEVLQEGLRASGYHAEWVTSLRRARQELRTQRWDLVITDVRLPDGSGLELCSELRSSAETPVIVVSAADTVQDRVAGFEAGADDYVVKPMHLAELRKRVEAVLRRARPRQEAGILTGPGRMRLNTSSGDVTVDGATTRLTRSELGILTALLEQPGLARSAEELCRLVWNYEVVADANFIQQHVSRLRRKLATIGAGGAIRTVYGMGYAVMDESAAGAQQTA